MSTGYLIAAILVMAIVTYLIRAIPLGFFQKQITSPKVKAFLFYIPYSVLGAMTVPAIFFCTRSIISAAVGFAAACVTAFLRKGLLATAVAGAIGVYITELIIAIYS